MKSDQGIWNGKIRDWVGNVRDHRVTTILVSSKTQRIVEFPVSGLDSISAVRIDFGFDSGVGVKGVGRFSKLETFSSGGGDWSKLRYWPAGLFEARGLKSISFVGNKIGYIPDSIVYLSALEKIDFRGNSLTGIPSSVMGMASMKWFYVEGNMVCSPTQAEINWLQSHSVNWESQTCSK